MRNKKGCGVSSDCVRVVNVRGAKRCSEFNASDCVVSDCMCQSICGVSDCMSNCTGGDDRKLWSYD